MSPLRWPSGERGGAGKRPLLILTALICAVLAIRLTVAASLHLTEDEAYYRLWSFSPALGYYDHPPMIAWWIWLGRRVAGDTALGVRLAPSVACALTTFLVFDMARLAGAGRADSLRAAIWFNAMLLVAAGGFLAVPDAPAALFWALAVWSALRARRDRSPAWWAAAGIAAGFAALSKYSALFLAPGLLLWLAWDAAGRAELRRYGPWLAALLALGVFTLNVAWNASHHWVTFVKQFGRVVPAHFEPRYLLEFVGAQGLLLNPLIALFAVRRLVGRQPSPTNSVTDGAGPGGVLEEDGPIRLAPFLAVSIPFLVYLVVHSLHDRVQAHWPAPVYPAAAIVAAAGAQTVSNSLVWSGLRRVTPYVAVAACAIVLALVALRPVGAPWPSLARPIEGWPAFAARLEAERGQVGAAWIGTTSYGLAAELADEGAITAPIAQISERARYQELGALGHVDANRPGLLVDLPRRIDPARLGACFREVQPLGLIDRAAAGDGGTPYALYRLAGPRKDVMGAGC